MSPDETFATLAEYLRFSQPELSKSKRVVCLEFREPAQASYVGWLLYHAIAGIPCPEPTVRTASSILCDAAADEPAPAATGGATGAVGTDQAAWPEISAGDST